MTTILDEDNRLFTLAKLGRRPPSGLVAIAVVFFMLLLWLIPGQILSRLILRLFSSRARPVAAPIVENVAMFLPIYMGLWVWLRFLGKRPFWTLGLERQFAVQFALRGMLFAALMMTVTAEIVYSPGRVSFTPGLWQNRGISRTGEFDSLSLLA